MDRYPRISVIIPTCNRPDDVRRALESLAALEYPSWELVVVDQSDDSRTQEIVSQATEAIPVLRYLRAKDKGCSRARNLGIQETDGEILGFLDDDCTVQPDWLCQAAEVLHRHPDAALLLGELRRFDGEGEWAKDGWIPIRHFAHEFEARVQGNMRLRLRIWSDLMGNAACMFARRSLVPRIGYFDTEMGGGGYIPAAEDGDYIYRALMAGCSVIGAPSVVADHHGLRDYESGAATRLLRDYQYAIGAWHMKVLRLGDPFALWWICQEYRHTLESVRVRNILTGKKPLGLLPIVTFTRGLIGSFSLRVDRKRRLYLPSATK